MCATPRQFLPALLASMVMVATVLGVERTNGQVPKESSSEVEELKTSGEVDDLSDLDGTTGHAAFQFHLAAAPACDVAACEQLPQLSRQGRSTRGPPRETFAAA